MSGGERPEWLTKFSPDQWIHASLGELRRAEEAYAHGDARGGTTGVKRAAGMALNAALLVEPDESWGRTYLEHLTAVERDARVPEAVRRSCKAVLDAKAPGGMVVMLRTPGSNTALLEAARDVIAHAFAVVKRHEALPE